MVHKQTASKKINYRTSEAKILRSQKVRSLSLPYADYSRKEDMAYELKRFSEPYINQTCSLYKLTHKSNRKQCKYMRKSYDIAEQMHLRTNRKSRVTDGEIRCTWLSNPHDSTCLSRKLIEVYGHANVGKKSLIHCLRQTTEETELDTKAYDHFIISQNDKQEVFTFRNMEAPKTEDETTENEGDACLVMFSVTNAASFLYAKHTIQSIRRHYKENTAIILVANKTDIVRSRKVSINEAAVVAKIQNCVLIETSMMLNYNVDKVLKELLHNIQIPQQERSSRRSKFYTMLKTMRTAFSKCISPN